MEPPDRREQALVGRAMRGDLGAAEALLVRHLGDLDSFVRRRAKGLPQDKESISDLVQSICLTVLVKLHDSHVEYRGEREFRAWIYEAATFAIGERRRYWAAGKRDPARESRPVAAPQGPAPETVFPSRSRTPSGEVSLTEEADRTRHLLAELPERYRRVIELARVEGLAHREIADRLGGTEQASRMLLNRALAHLNSIAAREDRRTQPPR